MRTCVVVTALLGAIGTAVGWAQQPVGTTFTYQGQLKHDGAPVTGAADFQFRLWDDPNDGNPIGLTVETRAGGYAVIDGLFSIELDFNPPGQWIFDGTALWMETAVRCPAGSGDWETLSPRQRLTATPYASFSTVATAVPWAGILDMPAGFADGIDDVGDGSFWSLHGNAGTIPGTHFLGTTDDAALELRVNGARALRLEPTVSFPNVIAGYVSNDVDNGVVAATIGGGKDNSVHSHYATVSGGSGNEASAWFTTVSGGELNVAGDIAGWATIAGGRNNEATQEYAMIPGGMENLAGGEYSFAAGRRAKVRDPNAVGGGDVNGDEGTFVWADSQVDEFWSTGPNQFLIRASGGVGIGTNDPQSDLHVNGDVLAGAYTLASSHLASGSFAHSDTLGGTLKLQYAPAAIAYQMTFSSVEGIKGWALMSNRFQLTPSDDGDNGAALTLMNAGTTTVKLDGSATNGAGKVVVKNAAGQTQITLDGDTGTTSTNVLVITGGSDLSERFNIAAPDGPPQPGMVVCIDPLNAGQLTVSRRAYDRTVAGIISGAGDVKPGMLMGQAGTLADGTYPVALSGRVWTWCDASASAIRPGNLLTTSDISGHAMKAGDHVRAQGAIIGKAMTALDDGQGLVLVLVSLQ